MAINIDDSEADGVACEVAALAGKKLTEALRKTLAKRLEPELRKRRGDRRLAERLDEIARHCASLTELDSRSAVNILGYNAIRALPHR